MEASGASGPFRLAGAGAVALAAAGASLTRADPDLWGHVRFGADILSTRSLTAVDPYSFTQDRPWINHEWLSEVIMGWAWNHGGSSGLVALKTALTLGTMAAIWFALRRVHFPVRLGVLALVVVGTVPITATLRPQLWSMLWLALVCWILVSDSRARRWWLPLIFLVWANLHGAWIVGFAVLTIWTLVEWAVGRGRLRPSGVVVAAALVATLGTPYGWTSWRFLADTVSPVRPMIEEWQALWVFPPQKWVPFLAAVAGAIWVLRRSHPLRWPVAAVLVTLAAASVRTARVYPLFVVAAAVLLASMIEALSPLPRGRSRPASGSDWVVAALIALVLAPAGVWMAAGRCIDRALPGMPDREAVVALSRAPAGRLVTYFNWGEYAIWHLGPRLRVSMDGRRETVYSDQRLAQHDAILAGTAEGLALLNEWRPEYVWLPASSTATRAWLERSRYRIEVSTPRSFVAVRSDVAPWPTAAATVAPAMCFPD